MSLWRRCAGRCHAAFDRLGIARLHHGQVALEADRVHVGDVVGDDVQPPRLGLGAFGRDVESVGHVASCDKRERAVRIGKGFWMSALLVSNRRAQLAIKRNSMRPADVDPELARTCDERIVEGKWMHKSLPQRTNAQTLPIETRASSQIRRLRTVEPSMCRRPEHSLANAIPDSAGQNSLSSLFISSKLCRFVICL